MILMAFLEPELPVRAGVPCSEFAMEGNGRRGRETGKEGALVRVRGGLGRPREASGDETCGLTVVGLRVDGPADMVMRAERGAEDASVRPGERVRKSQNTHPFRDGRNGTVRRV